MVEESNYYPFGLKHKGYNSIKNIGIGNASAQKFGFGGKELQDELNLDWYDVSARNYDPALGRWMNLDPLSEDMRRHSPYNFAFNNPVYFIDPDGMIPGPGDWLRRKANQVVSAVTREVSRRVNKTVKNVKAGIVSKVKSTVKSIKKVFYDSDEGINGISKNGTNQGQKKGGTNTITVNMDDVPVPGGPHSKGAANIGKLAKESTTVVKKVKNTVQSFKNGMGDAGGAEKISTLMAGNTSEPKNNTTTLSIAPVNAKLSSGSTNGVTSAVSYGVTNKKDTIVQNKDIMKVNGLSKERILNALSNK
ncbi:RHS repeat domain-containing protein [Tenacibaculum finnmarkense]|uniref:RHS repeat domain-containing protein n=1 Tax=Tenacibaculum finnmarkense TaxID=2781243 RepID=UPI0021CE3A78|nr:RHS repeat-associated core domain-containing protein [Tenacibaculum finnmarkense]